MSATILSFKVNLDRQEQQNKFLLNSWTPRKQK